MIDDRDRADDRDQRPGARAPSCGSPATAGAARSSRTLTGWIDGRNAAPMPDPAGRARELRAARRAGAGLAPVGARAGDGVDALVESSSIAGHLGSVAAARLGASVLLARATVSPLGGRVGCGGAHRSPIPVSRDKPQVKRPPATTVASPDARRPCPAGRSVMARARRAVASPRHRPHRRDRSPWSVVGGGRRRSLAAVGRLAAVDARRLRGPDRRRVGVGRVRRDREPGRRRRSTWPGSRSSTRRRRLDGDAQGDLDGVDDPRPGPTDPARQRGRRLSRRSPTRRTRAGSPRPAGPSRCGSSAARRSMRSAGATRRTGSSRARGAGAAGRLEPRAAPGRRRRATATDTNDNAADWFVQAAPSPQGLAAPPVPAPGDPTPTPTATRRRRPTADADPDARRPTPTPTPTPTADADPDARRRRRPRRPTPTPTPTPTPDPDADADADRRSPTRGRCRRGDRSRSRAS